MGRTRWSGNFRSTTAINGVDDRGCLGDWDTFEIFEKFTIHRLCRCFEAARQLLTFGAGFSSGGQSFWQPSTRMDMRALEHALELRELSSLRN